MLGIGRLGGLALAGLLPGLLLASSHRAAAEGQTLQIGDRVHIGRNGDNGTIVAIQAAPADGGTMVKVKRDSNGFTMVYDPVAANVTLLSNGPAAGPQTQSALQQLTPLQAISPLPPPPERQRIAPQLPQ